MQEMEETWVQSLCQEGPLEEKMATHSSILDWKTPWTAEPGGATKSWTWLGNWAHTAFNSVAQLVEKRSAQSIMYYTSAWLMASFHKILEIIYFLKKPPF